MPVAYTSCLSDKEGPGTADAKKSKPQSFVRCYQAGEGPSRKKEHVGEGTRGHVQESMSLGAEAGLRLWRTHRREPRGSDLKGPAWDFGPHPKGKEQWKV